MLFRKLFYFTFPVAILFICGGCSDDVQEPVRSTAIVVPQSESNLISNELEHELNSQIMTHSIHSANESENYDHVKNFSSNQYDVTRNEQYKNITAPHPTPAVTQVTNTNVTHSTKLASHETEFDAKEKSRNTNITQAAKSVNGTVVQPGEIFSFNDTVGPTIKRRGYEKGIIYVQGEKKKGYGGGVCQVSSTIHVAARDAGMTILERHDHSLPVGYAKSGDEAATSYGAIDFKFKNDENYPVIINCNVENGKIVASVGRQ